MRFESVTAHAFGPFRGDRLPLAPGMNVVYGPNEAGKSTWHAALYAGLCGIRRGRGRMRSEDEAFAKRHRPWDGDGSWEVGAVVTLEDGRRVELRHDLAGRVDSSARDADIAGRDYSNEIMPDGTPDGSRWLGLDRRSFLSTACVRQAEILKVLDDASQLQDELQRAAGTAGTDATAAQALDLLRSYHTQHVGTERAWTRPLQRSRDEVVAARRALEDARQAHDQYLERCSRVEHLEKQVRTLERQVEASFAVLAEEAASRAEERLAGAQALSAGLSEGPPLRPSEEDRLVQQVATALQTWRTRPDLLAPSGSTVAELEQQLTEIDRQLTGPASTSRDVVPAGRRSVAWPVSAAGGVIVGIGLAAAGLLVQGILLSVLSLALLGWWGFGRAHAVPAIEPGASAALGERHRHIEHLIEDRREEERVYAGAVGQHERAEEIVHRAALAVGLATEGPEVQVEALREWQGRRQAELADADRQRADWEELQRLLGEHSLDEFTQTVRRLRADAETLAARVDATVLAASRAQVPTDAELKELERQAGTERDAWNTGRGQLNQFAQDLPSVAHAEEVLVAAERRLDRVERLDQILGATIGFLERAEERVHRDIAPVLRETVLEWLPRVTGGRYVDCRVDPESLAVEVSGPEGRWRQAELLSRGTAEQLYLLLRLALSRHLTSPNEVCPLILDDAVGACDSERKPELLETLLAISESVQVILFTHEDDVRDWARARLSGPDDLMTELDAAGVPV